MIDSVLFWSKVAKSEGCWEWQAGHFPNGYGCFTVKRKAHGAHRVAWTIARGPVPSGLWVLHRCDNRNCVRPDHLFLGTNQENIADKMAKGRHRALRGMERNQAKLRDADVRWIRLLASEGAISQREIAEAFGVSQMAVSNIKLRKSWRHVT